MTVAKLLQAARQAYAANDLTACRSELDQALALDPGAPEALRLAARLAYRERDWTTLREQATACVAAQPNDAEMAQLLARACSNLRQWPAAAAAWSRVALLRPDLPEAAYQEARALWAADRPFAAGNAARRLQELGKADDGALLLASRLALEMGRLEEAAQAFAALAAQDEARVQSELHSCEKHEDTRGCAVLVAAVIRQRPREALLERATTLAEALVREAAVHERQGQTTEAYLDYTALALVQPDDPLAARSRQRILRQRHAEAQQHAKADQPLRAVQLYREILRSEPADEQALSALGRILMAQAEWDAAAEVWRRLLELAPHDVPILLQLARALDRSQQFEAALAGWNDLLAADSGSEEAARALARLPGRMVKAGRAAFVEGRLPDAARILQLVPESSAEHADAAARLEKVGRHLLKEMRAAYKERRFRDVVDRGAVAARILAGDESAQRLLAQAAMKTRDYALAAEGWQRLARLVPDPANHVALARCQLRLGQRSAAQATVDRVLAEHPHFSDALGLHQDLRELPDASEGMDRTAAPS